jgi:ABC-2 type transport system ATP-binding protein
MMSPRRGQAEVAAVDADRTNIAVRSSGLVKRFEDVVAVDGIDLVIHRGECVGLLGPNGAGKTTTMEILEGLTVPDRGEVEVLGCRWGRGRDREMRTRIGVQLQETQLAERLTVEETIRLFRSFYPAGREVGEVLELLGLTAKRTGRVHKLSGGQRQRLALACALVGLPELLFLDEPTTGLDPQARLRIWEVVEAFRAGGGAVLLTTHSMEEAARLCDRVEIIDHGKVIAEGPPAALVDSLGAEQIVEFHPLAPSAGDAPALDEAAVATLPGVSSLTRRNGAVMLRVSRIGEALPALLAELEQQGVGLESLATKQPTLEDVFVSLTGRGLRDE